MFARHKTPTARLIVGVALCLLALAASVSLAHAFAPVGEANGAPKSKVQSPKSGLRPLTNRIVQENALAGTDEWANLGNYDINALSAFPGATSVNAGSSINIHVSSTGSSLSARLYRLGYYQNHGARLYTTYSGIATPAQPLCTRNSSTGLVQCPWLPTFAINTDPNWVSGIYLLRLDSDNGFRFFVYFTVRNDSYPSDILVMEPTKTNQAYNRYGGESLYYSGNNEGRARAYQVSFDRPYSSGAGTGGLFTHDIEMVRWLEASGYDVSYISDVDRAATPDMLLSHRVYMDMGHDEYWSWGERDAVDAAVAEGVNVIFASGNESYWNVRLSASSNGPNRIITCYKDAAIDPTQTPPGLTVTFRDLGRPENMLVGTGYQSFQDDAQYNGPWTVSAPATRWYFGCTGLQPGVVVNNIVGEEWDALLGSGGTPAGIEAISNGMVVGNNGLQYPQNSAIYTSQSGAMVFSAGSIHWSWGLMDHSYANQVFQSYALSNDADGRIEQLMANIIDRFAGYWDGQARQCGPPYGYYNVGNRATRTPKPQPPTATGTPPTATRTRTATSTPSMSVTIAPSRTRTTIASATPSATSTPTQSATALPTTCQVSYTSADVPKQIPDLGTTTSILTVNGGGTISGVVVTGISVSHTYSSDLVAYLISPQGTRVELFSHRCANGVWTGSNTGFALSDDAASQIGSACPPGQGTFRPQGTLATLAGQQAAGVWTLEMTDDGQWDTGTLNGWGLRITYGGTACSTGTPVATSTHTATYSGTSTPTRTRTAAPTNTAVSTATRTNTSVSTATATPTRTNTGTTLPSATRTRTASSTATSTRTSTRTSTAVSATTSTRTSTPRSTSTQTSTVVRTSTSTQVVATATQGTLCQVGYVSLDVPKAVPDQGSTTSTITLADAGTIADIAITDLTIAHTYSSDLRLFLTSPQGTRVELFSYRCGSSVWTTSSTGFSLSGGAGAAMGSVCPPGQGAYLPVGSLMAFAGQSAQGTWTLEVTDAGPWDTGTLYGWRLQITYSSGTCPNRTPTAFVPESPPPCTISFVDVPAESTFYEYVQWMACQGYVSGYACGGAGEPCPGSHFRPGATVTRGQLLKMVVNAAGGVFVDPETPTFADVSIDNAFYTYIETAASHGIIGGYPCSGPGEPCDTIARPYFRPGNNITRGQLSKVVALARRMDISPPEIARFADVPADSPFSGAIEAVARSGLVSGYPCGGPGEPCDSANRPYFRPSTTATRGQVSKIVTRGYDGR